MKEYVLSNMFDIVFIGLLKVIISTLTEYVLFYVIVNIFRVCKIILFYFFICAF